jgi:hypothetical protein
MNYSYEATNIGYDDSESAFTVGFGGLPDEDNYPTISLLLQRSTDDAEDVPGVEGVYVEWCDQSNSCYGCIEDFQLERNSARIKFAEAANLLVDLNQDEKKDNRLSKLVVTFDIDEATYQKLKDSLSRIIFRDCRCFTAVV